MQSLKILLLPFMFILLKIQETEWKKSLDKDDIIVYTRKIEGKRFSEILAVTKMNGSVDKFKSIITNVDGYTHWITDSKSAEVIESSNSNEITYHMKLKVPFPFENRDIVQQINLNESTDKLEVVISNQPDMLPREKKYERMVEAFGTWTVEAINESEVSIKFQYYADPSGEIPAWLVNAFIVKNPHQTLKNLRALMQ
jgi:hypothetical protein